MKVSWACERKSVTASADSSNSSMLLLNLTLSRQSAATATFSYSLRNEDIKRALQSSNNEQQAFEHLTRPAGLQMTSCSFVVVRAAAIRREWESSALHNFTHSNIIHLRAQFLIVARQVGSHFYFNNNLCSIIQKNAKKNFFLENLFLWRHWRIGLGVIPTWAKTSR